MRSRTDVRAARPEPWLLFLLLACAGACGVRSDPFDLPGTAGGGGGGGDGGRGGTCDDAEALAPLEDAELTGTLPVERGSLSGWCGRDGGAEDVYVLDAQNDRDILVVVNAVDPDGFVPTVRVEVDTCGATEAVTDEGYTELCFADPMGGRAYIHTEIGRRYTITVDAPEGEGGDYSVILLYQPPLGDECPLHPETPFLQPGSYFLWSNTLGGGQGRIQGLCGGPGTENMFLVTVDAPGVLRARATSNSPDAEPIVDVRNGCAFVDTLDCQRGAAGGVAEVQVPVDPGIYYVTVDHHGVGTFAYDLEMWLE